ncbi:translation initiation factor 2 [Methylobacterium sp. NEAU K]|uniref:translation initiation factor 2 n=1 Tax=Methylobacterium sp. NEAU K TaxID=3064946 RepID=UPI0027333F29|nr:translation initiation factor 2 [Methylobacterium sp. NEAU K]MDP4002898.1 translation initiation factor 2 [Methylobacterium sp. NEAU K]
MTPPPSDADKPGPGGQKPGAAPSMPPQSDSARTDAKPGDVKSAEAKPVDAKQGAKSPAPAAGGAKPASTAPIPTPKPAQEAASGAPAGTPLKPATDPGVPTKPGAVDAKPEASKLGAADGPKPSVSATGRPVDAKVEPSQAGGPAPSSPEPAKTASATAGMKSEPGKIEPGKIEPGKIEPAKSESGKPEAAQPGRPGPAPQTGAGPRPGDTAAGVAAATLTAGPIIDLKAKRIPDPPVSGKEPTKDGLKDPAKEPAKGPLPGAASGEAARAANPPAARARAGFGSVAAAGLLGGLIGAGVLFGVEKAGIGGDPRLNALDQKLSSQVASLDKRLDGLAPRDALAALDKRVATAESTAKQALDKSSVAPAPAAGATEGQSPGQASAVPADLVARLDSLDQRVAALQEEPGRDQTGDSKLGAVQAGDTKQLSDLDARLKAIEADAANKGDAADASKRLAALQSEVEQRTKANADADAALGQRLDTLQQALDARVKAATEAVQAAAQASRSAAEAGQTQAAEVSKAVDRRLQEQGDKIAALDKSVAQRAETTTVQAALRVVVADRVAAALSAGMPYAEPLATLRKLDPGAEAQAAALAPFAETGAPTTAQLADAFRPIAEQIAAKRRAQRARSAAETGDFRAKLLSMADGLVQVRKVDAPPAPEASDDPEAKVQAALDRGDLLGASAAFAALPPEARDQAGDFGARLKARTSTEEAVRSLLADAFKALPTGAGPGAAAAAPGR